MKNGLALGSGGVKGYVHLGVLQYLYEQNITFDYVAGSSVGSIVGAMYCLNYTPYEMAKTISDIGLERIQNLFYARLSGLENIASIITKNKSFSDLKKQLKIVAVNLNSGNEVVFDSGKLCLAISCSCAIPPYIKPQKINDIKYVDGAFFNSVPADIVKNMGAEKVLSINLNYGLTNNYNIVKTLNKMYPKNMVGFNETTWQCYRFSSVILEPDLIRFKTFDFSHISELFDIGYYEAKQNSQLLKTFLE